MKKLLLLSTIFILSSLSISAQTPQPLPRQINGGVLNGKATSLIKPAFPAAARAVGASGVVSVQVLIDEEGNVASASAVSGHPLLRQAAVQAALASKFSPTMLSGQPVKISGIIVYNFVSDMNFTQIGFDLALIEKSKETPENIFVGNITGNIPADWEKERSALSALEMAMRKLVIAEPATEGIGQGSVENKTSATESYTADIKTVQSAEVIRGTSLDRAKLAAELQNDIENRLTDEKENLWKFKVGKSLGRIAAQIDDDARIKTETARLNELLANIPNGISDTNTEKLRNFVVLLETNDFTPERKTEIIKTAQILRNFR